MEAVQALPTTEQEQIIISFSNGHGGSYDWNVSHGNENLTLETATTLQQDIVGLKVASADDHDAQWVSKNAPHYKQPKQTRTKATTTTRTVIKEFIFATDPELLAQMEAAEAERRAQRNWLFTPKNVETWHHETLVQHLKKFYRKSHDGDTFLAYLRMILKIYRSDLLTLDKTVARGDFYEEVRTIFNLNQQWSYQMIAALPEIKFMFSSQEWTLLKNQLDAQKRLQSKDVLSKTEDVALAVETPDVMAPAEMVTFETETETSEDDTSQKKRPGKALRNKLKNYQNQQRNVNTSKKKRGLFYFA